MKRTFTILCTFLLSAYTLSAGNYCSAWGKNNTYGWISAVTIGSMYSSSSYHHGGYGDYSHKSISCSPGKSYTLKLKPHNQYGHHEQAHWGVWADWNHDGYFQSHEQVLDYSSRHEVSSWLKVPSHAKYGKTKIRIIVRYLYKPNPCGYSWYGEVEDYTLNVGHYQDPPQHYDPKYCAVYGKNDTYGYIKNVELADLKNPSWFSHNGYHDYTKSKVAHVEAGETYDLTLMPFLKNSSGWYNSHAEIGHWRVWVDWDQNHKFEDDEIMVDSSSFDPLELPFTVPDDAKTGKTRMRVALRFIYKPKACGSYWYGEVEDYTVSVGSTPEPDPVDYCHVGANNDTYGYIHHVELGSIDKTSHWSTGGYADYTDYSTDLTAGKSHAIRLKPTLQSSSHYGSNWHSSYQPGYWVVWIDFNQDGHFSDKEKVLWAKSNSKVWKYIKVPHDAKAGPTRMRVALRFFYWPTACGTYWYGEVEDYTVNILGGSHSGYGSYFVDNGGFTSPGSSDVVYREEARVFPNPAHEVLRLELPNSQINADVMIRNMQGQMVRSLNQYESRSAIQLADLPNGSYYLEWQDQTGEVKHKKFIKN